MGGGGVGYGGSWVGGGGGQGGCERRIDVFWKIHKLISGWGSVAEGVRWGGGWVGGGGGVRVDVNAMLGEGGYVGYGGCEPRIEGIVQIYKKVLYNIKEMKNCGGGGWGGAIFEPKTLSMYLKKEKGKKKKKMTEPGFEPTTSGLEIH